MPRPAQREEGQWALGGREPLNAAEQSRRTTTASTSASGSSTSTPATGSTPSTRPTCAAGSAGGACTPSAAQGIHGGKTAALEDADELEDTLLHAAGAHPTAGGCRAEQLRAIAGISRRVRPRRRRHHRPAEHPATLDPHRGRAGDLAAARGRRPDHDRGVRRHPARHARLPARRHRRRRGHRRHAACSQATVATYVGDPGSATCRASARPSMSRLRRPLHRATRSTTSRSSACVNADGAAGFDLWVGGGLSTNPMFAQRLGVFVAARPGDRGLGAASPRSSATTATAGSATAARMKFLMADWGPEKFREVLEKEYLGRALPDGPAPRRRRTAARPRRRPPAEGRRVLRRLRAAGRPDVSGTQLADVADLADAHGGGPGPDDGAAEAGRSSTCPTTTSSRSSPRWPRTTCRCEPSAFRRGTMACTGIEFCKLAIVETKSTRQDLVRRAREAAAGLRQADRHQRQRLPELLRPVPGRRHRPQGLDGPRRRRRDGRGLPGAPRRPPRRRGARSAASSAASR